MAEQNGKGLSGGLDDPGAKERRQAAYLADIASAWEQVLAASKMPDGKDKADTLFSHVHKFPLIGDKSIQLQEGSCSQHEFVALNCARLIGVREKDGWLSDWQNLLSVTSAHSAAVCNNIGVRALKFIKAVPDFSVVIGTTTKTVEENDPKTGGKKKVQQSEPTLGSGKVAVARLVLVYCNNNALRAEALAFVKAENSEHAKGLVAFYEKSIQR